MRACALPSCNAVDVTLLRCGRCQSTLYCSVAHQRADYPAHRVHCVRPATAADPPVVVPAIDVEQQARARASIGTRYDPTELPLAQSLRLGEQLAVLLSADADIAPQTIVLSAADAERYLSGCSKARLIETSGAIPLVVAAAARDPQSRQRNESAAWLLLDLDTGAPADRYGCNKPHVAFTHSITLSLSLTACGTACWATWCAFDLTARTSSPAISSASLLLCVHL